MGRSDDDDLEKEKDNGDDELDDDPWEAVSFDASEESSKEKPKAAVAVADAPKDGAAKSDDQGGGAAAKVDAGLEKLPKLTGDELKRSQYLQETLKNLVPVFLEPKLSDEIKNTKPAETRNEKIAEEMKKQMKEVREALQKERESGVFGPASQEAYKQYTNWLQKAVPQTIRELDTLNVPLPPGSPIPLESDRYGRAMDPALYKALANDERIALELKVEPGKVPTDTQLDKLDAVYNWLAKSNAEAAETRGRQRDAVIEKLINDNGLPPGWKKQPGDDPQTWRNSAEEMIDLSMRTRNYVEAMQSLFKASKDSDFPIELPRGTKLVIEDTKGKLHTISDNQLVDPQMRQLWKTGTIKEVKLDMPQDLRQEDPANKEKITRLRDWLDTHGDRINQAISELKKLKENPDAVIMYGDQEIANGKGVFNEKDELVRIVNSNYRAKPGEQIKDLNLVGYNFDVEQIKEGPNKGKYKISQTIQAEQAPWYAYQNIRAFGIDNVGKPMNLNENREPLGADDFVPVKNGSKIEMVKVKNLQSFKDMQKLHYYGEKALSITMDAAMLVSGSIEIGAAIKGARLAAVGAQAGLKLGLKEATWEIGKGALRVGVAGSGIFNNAGAREHEWGRNINTARGIYFLADIGLGLGRGGWNLFKAGKASETMSSAEKVHTIIRGKEAVAGAEAIKGIPWIKNIHKGTEWAFKATEFGFAPVIIGDLKHQIGAIQDHGKRDPAKDALIQVGDGRGMQKAEKGSFDPNNPKALEAARQAMDSYKATLTRGRSDDTATEIKKIFDKTKALMGPDAKEEDKAAYRQELLAKMSFSPEQVRDLEKAHPRAGSEASFQLNNQDLHDLMDPDKRKNFPKAVAEMAEKFMSEKDKDVLAAAQTSLLYMSRDKDGHIKPELAKLSLDVPEYKRSIWHPGDGESPGYSQEITVKARSAEQNITTAELARNLQKDLEDPNLGNRGIVTGEVLTRIGALTHQQYGGVLQDVLRNPQASREDKLQALADANGPRLAAVIDGVRYQEDLPKDDTTRVGQERAAGKSHGLTSQALMAQLEKSAKEDKDPDVRAMSAALLYGLRERNLERRSELLSGFNTLLDQNRGAGEFAKKAEEFLKSEMKTEIPEAPPELADRVREARLHAALSLSLVKGDAAAQKEINEAIAKSISPTNIALSTRVMEALMLERLAQLQKDNKQLADEVRLAAVAMVKKPDNFKHEAEMVKFLSKLEPFLKDGPVELKQQLQSKLHELLRAGDLNPGYAKYFPTLRVAAIETLAELRSMESLDIIRSHATAEPSIKLAGKDAIPAKEDDASVRIAAIKALEKMGDPFLRPIVNDLVDKETDPRVASQLRDVEFLHKRIEPDSKEWKQIEEDTRKDIIGSGKLYPYLDNFDVNQAEAWLKGKEGFDLLIQKDFVSKLQSAVIDSTESRWHFWYKNSTLEGHERTAGRAKDKERGEQFAALVELAKRNDEEGNKAKKTLYFITTGNGAFMGSAGEVSVNMNHGDKNRLYNYSQPHWDRKAAVALRELAKSDVESMDLVKKYVSDALKTKDLSKGDPAPVSENSKRFLRVLGASEQDIADKEKSIANILLEGWEALAKKSKGDERREYAFVTAEALKVELRRDPGARDAKYQEKLIQDLKASGYRSVLPVLAGMLAEKDKLDKDAVKAVQDMFDSYMYSTKMMWDETKPDQTSTEKQRADRLKEALADKLNAETTVQQIFNAYKDYKIKDAKDPGLAQLQIAMNDNNERVRLAASRVLMNSDLPNNNPAKLKAISTLASLSMSASNKAYQSEAFGMLKGLNLEKDKPLLISAGSKFYKVEKDGDNIKATEFTKKPGQDQPQASGYLYPNGQSFAWQTNPKGELTQVWENGSNYQRRTDGEGKLINEWKDPETGKVWKGEYNLLPNGEYRYQTQGQEKIWTRKADGRLVDVVSAQERLKQNEVIAASALEISLAGATTPQDKIKALKEHTQNPPISSNDDGRIAKILDLLNDKDQSVRLEAASSILRGTNENFANKGFSSEERQKAYASIDSEATSLIQKGLQQNNAESLALLERALESANGDRSRSELATLVENRGSSWEKASQLLNKHLGDTPFVETLPGGTRRETRKAGSGILVAESKNGELTKVVAPEGSKYADLLVKDLNTEGLDAARRLVLARQILESKLDIGTGIEHKSAALKELSKLSSEAAAPISKRLEAATLFLKIGGDKDGSDQVWRALLDMSMKSTSKDAARALVQQQEKISPVFWRGLDGGVSRDVGADSEKKEKLSFAVALASSKFKTEPQAEAALYQLYGSATKLGDQAQQQKISEMLDRTKPDSGLSPIQGKDDPRLAPMSKLLEDNESDTVRLSAALALIDSKAKDVPAKAAENARITLHNEIKNGLQNLRNNEAQEDPSKKPTEHDWAKLDYLMAAIGQDKNDYGRLYIESKRLEFKQDYKALAGVYESLAALSKERGSETGEKLYLQRAAEAKQMADPEIQEASRKFQEEIKESRNAKDGEKQNAERKLEAQLAKLAAKTGNDSVILANAYQELARYYGPTNFDKADQASTKATEILNALASARMEHLQTGWAGGGGENKHGNKKLATLPIEGSSGESVKLADNNTLKDMLDYQFSTGSVGADVSSEAQRLAKQSLVAKEQTFGPGSKQAANARESLGDVLLKSGNTVEAEKLYKENLDNPATLPAERGRLTAKVAQSIMFRGPEGQMQAIKLIEDNLQVMHQQGANPQEIASQMQQYANLMAQRGDGLKAQDLIRRAEHMRKTGNLMPASPGHYGGHYGGPAGGLPPGPTS